MTTKKSKIGKSQQEARKLMRSLFPGKITGTDVVHHIDLNPLNNELNNLHIMDKCEHQKLHLKLKGISELIEKSRKFYNKYKETRV